MTSLLYSLARQRKHMLYDIVDAETPAEESDRKNLEIITDTIREVLGIDTFIDPSANLKEDLNASDEKIDEILDKLASHYDKEKPEKAPETVQGLLDYFTAPKTEKKEESSEAYKPRTGRRLFRHI